MTLVKEHVQAVNLHSEEVRGGHDSKVRRQNSRVVKDRFATERIEPRSPSERYRRPTGADELLAPVSEQTTLADTCYLENSHDRVVPVANLELGRTPVGMGHGPPCGDPPR